MTNEPSPMPLAELLNQRHDIEGLRRVISAWALSKVSNRPSDVITDLCITVDQLVNIIHQLCHASEVADQIIDAIAVLYDPNGKMKAAISAHAAKDPAIIDQLHHTMAEDTIAADRVWSATHNNNMTTIELTGTGIEPRTALITPALNSEDTRALLTTLRERQ